MRLQPPPMTPLPALRPPAMRPVDQPETAPTVVIGPPGDLPVQPTTVDTASVAIDFRIVDAIRSNVGPGFAVATGADLSRLAFVGRAACRAFGRVPALNGHHGDVHLAVATKQSLDAGTNWPILAEARSKSVSMLALETHYPGVPEAIPTFLLAEIATSVDVARVATLTLAEHPQAAHSATLRLSYDSRRCTRAEVELFLSLIQAALHSADWHGEFG